MKEAAISPEYWNAAVLEPHPNPYFMFSRRINATTEEAEETLFAKIITCFAAVAIQCNMNDGLMARFQDNPKKYLKEQMGIDFSDLVRGREDQFHLFIDNESLRWPLMIIYSKTEAKRTNIIVIPECMDYDPAWLVTPPTLADILKKEDHGKKLYPKAFNLLPLEDSIDKLKDYQIHTTLSKSRYVHFLDKIEKAAGKCHIIYILPFVSRHVDLLSKIDFEDSEIVLSSC